MTVLRSAAIAGMRQQQVWPVDYETEASQKLVEAVAKRDFMEVEELLQGPRPVADVNFAGAVWLKSRRVEVVLRENSANECCVVYDDIRTDASPLFLAAHAGDINLVRLLLDKGADVNQEVFRGYAITAAVREGWADVSELLIRAGASQLACEEALVEAALHGWGKLVKLLMNSDLIRSHSAAHAFVSAAARGFVDVVHAFLECGIDVDATDRVLLCSLNPSLHANVDSPALFAAVVSRQTAVVDRLLQVGVRKDSEARLGAWSWDQATGEELRVGAGLGEPYNAAWCAVEYYESSGTILAKLLEHYPVNARHRGRTLLHHAILCGCPGAVEMLLTCGSDVEIRVMTTTRGHALGPAHLAARLNQGKILRMLIDGGCRVDSRTESGDTPLMLSARYKSEDCARILISAGADLSLVNSSGQSVFAVATCSKWSLRFESLVLDVMHSGIVPQSSDRNVFMPLMFAAERCDISALGMLLAQPESEVDEQNEDGLTPVMAAAKGGHVDAFRVLVFAGANVKLKNIRGETALTLSHLSQKRDLFEQVMLEYALEKGMLGGFLYALHFAARRGDITAVRLLTSKCMDVNAPDIDGYTPLMLAAREGHASAADFLINHGADCTIETPRGETALSLSLGTKAEEVIMDELGRITVLRGARVKKHRKSGRCSPHRKFLRMEANTGVLTWGSGSRRNVTCVEAVTGASASFRRNRKSKGDADEPGLFRVVTSQGREVHFFCHGGGELADLWVRGIRQIIAARSAAPKEF